MQVSLDEVNLLVRLMKLEGKVRVEAGAEHAMPDESTSRDPPGASIVAPISWPGMRG